MRNFFYNIKVDLPVKLPSPLDSKKGTIVKERDLRKYLTKGITEQYFSTKKNIPMSEDLLKLYCEFRPSPLIRAKRLESYLKTDCQIYYKYEGRNPSGSHKINSALVEAYFAKKEGIGTLTSSTISGHWGYALSIAGKKVGINVKVFMVTKSDFNKDKYVKLMRKNGAEVIESLDLKMQAAMAKALEETIRHNDFKFAIGSLLDYVLLHNTLIGIEAKEELENNGKYPDVIIASCGIGSSLGGISFPFIGDYLRQEVKKIEVLAVEPVASASLRKGSYRYANPEGLGILPKLKMYSLPKAFESPKGENAGSLDYFGVSPIISLLYKNKLIKSVVVEYKRALLAQRIFNVCEGVVPSLESSYAIAGLIDKIKNYNGKVILLFVA